MIAVAATLWCGAFTLQPVLLHGGMLGKGLGHILHMGFAPLCHQKPERSFLIFGSPMAVCSRCAGIYYGGLLGIYLYPLLRDIVLRVQRSLIWLIVAAIPMCFDILFAWTGLPDSGLMLRSFTGIVLGIITMCYIIPGMIDWLAPKSVNM